MIVAAQALVATAMMGVMTFGFARKSQEAGVVEPPAVDPLEGARGLTLLLLVATTVILTTHNIRHEPTGLAGPHYRATEGVFVSIGSLAWPLLLQLAFWAKQVRGKIILVAFLAGIAAISPFRNVLFSALYFFGVLVPSGTMLIFFGRALSRRTKLFSYGAIVVVVLLASLIVLYQTERRLESREYEYQQRIVSSRVAVERALTSRALTPFFQAALADKS